MQVNNAKKGVAWIPVKFTIPTRSRVNFPRQCVICGTSAKETTVLALNRLITTEYRKSRKQIAVDIMLEVPYCHKCARLERRLFWTFFLATVAPFLSVAIPTFFFVYSWMSNTRNMFGQEVVTRQNMWLEEITAGCASLLAGFLAAGLISYLLKALLLPVFGSLLRHRPVFPTSMFTNREHVLGLDAQIADDGNTLTIQLANDRIAEAFAQLNPDAIPADH